MHLAHVQRKQMTNTTTITKMSFYCTFQVADDYFQEKIIVCGLSFLFAELIFINPVWLYNRSSHIVFPQYVMAGNCGMEKIVYSIINPYRNADPMTYRLLD